MSPRSMPRCNRSRYAATRASRLLPSARKRACGVTSASVSRSRLAWMLDQRCCSGAFGQRRAHRVEFDVAVDGQQMALAVDEARLEAALPERPAATVPMVERLHVAMAYFAHCAG